MLYKIHLYTGMSLAPEVIDGTCLGACTETLHNSLKQAVKNTRASRNHRWDWNILLVSTSKLLQDITMYFIKNNCMAFKSHNVLLLLLLLLHNLQKIPILQDTQVPFLNVIRKNNVQS